MRNMPVVIKDLDNFEASKSVLNRQQLLELLQSETVHDVRGGINGSFTYYSYKSPWHTRYKMKPTYKPIKNVGVSELQNFISVPNICKTVGPGIEGYQGIKNLCKHKFL